MGTKMMNENERLQLITVVMKDLKGHSYAEGDDLSGACWPGYQAIGLKEKDGRMVPNCVKVENKKHGFPIPSPSGESEDEFIGKCMSQLNDEFPDEKQRYAICISKWRGE